ncbi:MAG: tRNA (guanosine(46)-N7)-methyltransferase TrmB [Thermovirgaceae bacterium]|nr:tRNA (guanosine(46)-N7)-methyltransferase TrmB [Thermovirgaceae bacterium]
MIPVNRIFLNENPEAKIALTAGSDPPFRAVEIGFGNGEFLEHVAMARPEGVFFGIEVSLHCAMKAVKRIQRSGCENVRILFGDARFLLGECFPPEWLHAVYMNFPCPWPKSRHAKRRVTYSGFADVLAGSLVNGGVFELLTDDRIYAEEVARVIPAHPALEIEEICLDPKRDIQTKYERKWREQGKDIFLLRFRKKIPYFSGRSKKGEQELHSVLERACPTFDGLQSLAEMEGGEHSCRWVFKDSYVSTSGVMLLETITSDDGFRQSFFIRIVPREEGCLVKIDALSRPFRTPSVVMAFERLVDHLRCEIT